jgi:hypothetical protein
MGGRIWDSLHKERKIQGQGSPAETVSKRAWISTPPPVLNIQMGYTKNDERI